MTVHDHPVDDEKIADIMEKARVLVDAGYFDETFYASNYITPYGTDLFAHFFVTGYKEGRRPNPLFDPLWYLSAYPQVAKTGLNPLLEYAVIGERQGRNPSALFDVQWYRRRYKLADTDSPLLHYLQHRTGPFSPIPEFDAEHYLATNPDVVAAGIDPFDHYLHTGFKEARTPSTTFDARAYALRFLKNEPNVNPIVHYRVHKDDPDFDIAFNAEEPTVFASVKKFSRAGQHFAELSPLPATATRQAKVFAYYLTQFHAIPENDLWWGKGFTEWSNVGRGQPRFPDHYQPRTPRDLGFYNLLDVEVMRRQVEMARAGGLFGFIFYYYWFDGKRLLEKPLENFLAAGDIDMPFCLMWANENWTRRWDGAEQEVLIAQNYGPDDDEKICADFVRHFRDKRYYRIDGRPVLMVYRPGLIKDATSAIANWRRIFSGFGEDPILVMAQCFNDNDPRPFGLDGAIEFPPHKLTADIDNRNPDISFFDTGFTGNVFDYEQIVEKSLGEDAPEFPLIKTIVPSWDNDARRQGSGLALRGSTPRKYEAWLSELIARADENRFFGEKIVCVNAWNEWCEGAYLEPDVYHGAAYLNATARAVAGVTRKGERLLLVGHDAFPSGAQQLLLNIGRSLRTQFGIDIEFLLIGGGAMEKAYAAVAPLTLAATRTEQKRAIEEKAKQGFVAALMNTTATGEIAPLLKAAGLGTVLLGHEMPRILKEKGLETAARKGLETADRIVFPAKVVRDSVAAALDLPLEARAIVRPQGSYKRLTRQVDKARDLRARMGVKAGAPFVLGAGYADMRKGFDLFLNVWKDFNARGVEAHFCWIGRIDENFADWLALEIEAAQKTGTFHLPGFIADPEDYFSAASVFFLSSREDPFPTVALEALSIGVPVVAFANSGGIPEFLAAETLGLVAPFGDVRCAAELIEKASKLAADTTFVARAQDTIETKFGFEAYARDLFHLAMPKTAKISVVVPNYNYAHCLTERLNTIFDQDHPVLEVIVLDDASSDNSFDVIHDVATARDRDVALVVNETNSGSVFRQWARAAKMATGEFIWIAEADDLSSPHFLSRLVEAMAIDPAIVMAFSDSRSIDGDGKAIGASYKPYFSTVEPNALSFDETFDGGEFVGRFLSVKNLILNVSGVLWRRDALAGALDACRDELRNFAMAGDWRLYVECLTRPGARIAYVAQPLNTHRRHAQSVTHSLKAQKHVEEIASMHETVRRKIRLGVETQGAQSRYVEEVSLQLTGRAQAAPGFANG